MVHENVRCWVTLGYHGVQLFVSLCLVHVGDVTDVSETNPASIFKIKLSKVGEFLCIHTEPPYTLQP
jgi:hypothetical protein